MRASKYDRNVTLICPTCGGSQFEMGYDIDEPTASVKCISCDRELTKDELIRENSPNIKEHASEIGKEAKGDFAKEMKKMLKKAFSGNKNIKFR